MSLLNLIPGAGLLRTAAYVALAASLGFGAGYLKGRADEREAQQIDALKAAIEAERARKDIDHETSRLDDYDLCIALGGLPDQCDDLRRLDTPATDQ